MLTGKRWVGMAVVALIGCADEPLPTGRTDAQVAPDASGPGDAAVIADAAAPDGFVPGDMGTPLPAQECVYRSSSFGSGMLELDVTAGSTEVLTFDVPGLPAPALVDAAELRFRSYDADHPGEEGVITVNDSGPFDLPAMASWDNMEGTGIVDVTGALVAGDNQVRFGAGPLDRSFFRIGDVTLVVQARVAECEAPPDPIPGDAVLRSMHFTEASYTNRSTWVVPCPPGAPGHNALRNYAFTARGDEHDPTDCDGGYEPGGSRRGTAVFRFESVVAARYRVVIRSRHTENRNPAGALFVVNGEGRRIDQRTSSDYEEDVWGERDLSGTVEVVLDSTMEDASDCVTEVRLEPIGG